MMDRESLDATAAWEGSKNVRFQIDGNDLVAVTDIDAETGEAIVTVYASTAPDAEIAFTGTINVFGHAARA